MINEICQTTVDNNFEISVVGEFLPQHFKNILTAMRKIQNNHREEIRSNHRLHTGVISLILLRGCEKWINYVEHF